jgi:small neutral amino acid transporter SnatA (MarC family)
VAALPIAIAVAETTDAIELIDSAAAIPVAAVGGTAAVWLARAARRRSERTLGRVGELGLALAGRLLGILALCLATSSVIALVFYWVLQRAE